MNNVRSLASKLIPWPHLYALLEARLFRRFAQFLHYLSVHHRRPDVPTYGSSKDPFGSAVVYTVSRPTTILGSHAQRVSTGVVAPFPYYRGVGLTSFHLPSSPARLLFYFTGYAFRGFPFHYVIHF